MHSANCQVLNTMKDVLWIAFTTVAVVSAILVFVFFRYGCMWFISKK